MPVRSRSLVLAAGVALLTAGLLTACATPAGSGGTPAPSGSADSSGQSTEIEVDAAWLDGGRMIGLVTEGSSTCVPSAGETTYENAVLTVELVEPSGDTACTRDLVPRVTVVGLPEGVDPTQELEIRVTGEDLHGDTDLDGVPGLTPGTETDYLPSAGWTDTDGQFVLLTWGSSSCAPVISEVAASGPAEVTVTFETPAADQVCTMDMAPRAAVAVVDGLEEDSDVTLVLVGGPEFDNVRIPIYGSN